MPLKLKYGQGSIAKRTRKNKKGTVYVYYQGRLRANGEIITVTAKTQKECADRMKNERLNVKKGMFKPQNKTCAITLGEWLEAWYKLYKTPNLKDSSLRSIRNTLDVHIIPSIGKVKLKKITSNFLQEFMSQLTANNTRNKIYDVIRGSLRKATIEHYFIVNPADGIEIKKVSSEKRRAFSFVEQNNILETISMPKYKALFLFLCCTGLRIGEFLSLTPQDVDFKNGYIKIDSSKDQCTKKEGTTKNEVVRYVPFLPEIFEQIKIITGEKKFIGEYTSYRCKDYFSRFFNRIKLMDVSIHSTRHTFASVCYYLKVPDKYTQKWLGHTTLAMTVDIYTDLLGKGSSPISTYLQRLYTEIQSK